VILLPAMKDRTSARVEGLAFAALVSRPPTLLSLHGALAGCLESAPAVPRPSAPAPSAPARRFHILLAEDYELNQKLATRLLARLGYTCDVAENGLKALEATGSGAYDLILMDCQMPVMDGFEATRRIRQRELQGGGHIFIVAMTANAMAGDRERCLDAGMDDYLPKPIRVDALSEMLRKYSEREPV
jgi:CheY-like chemotaxis protein